MGQVLHGSATTTHAIPPEVHRGRALQVHTVVTDNGVQFTNRTCDRYAFRHIFDRVCDENGIEHRKTEVNHPWTNGQVERMNRTTKEATIRRYH